MFVVRVARRPEKRFNFLFFFFFWLGVATVFYVLPWTSTVYPLIASVSTRSPSFSLFIPIPFLTLALPIVNLKFNSRGALVCDGPFYGGGDPRLRSRIRRSCQFRICSGNTFSGADPESDRRESQPLSPPTLPYHCQHQQQPHPQHQSTTQMINPTQWSLLPQASSTSVGLPASYPSTFRDGSQFGRHSGFDIDFDDGRADTRTSRSANGQVS
jgi:hypothetical protein